MIDIPTPLAVPWQLKSADSAKAWVNELPDGRVQYCIEHQVIKGVSPAMIVWYLNHITDMTEVDGRSVQQYRLWHPIDHIALTYIKPATDGRNFGPGAQEIQRAFGHGPPGRPAYHGTVTNEGQRFTRRARVSLASLLRESEVSSSNRGRCLG
jgi:hypothetical protein